MLLVEDSLTIDEIDTKSFDRVVRISGQSQVHKMSFLCDIHKDIFKTDIGDSIQIKIANNLSDESKPPERTFMDVKSALDGPSLADSFPYIMNGRIYEISYPNELKLTSVYISHGGLLLRLQYDESKSDIGKFSKGETVFTCMKKVAY